MAETNKNKPQLIARVAMLIVAGGLGFIAFSYPRLDTLGGPYGVPLPDVVRPPITPPKVDFVQPPPFRPPLTVPTDATITIPPGLNQIGPNMDPLGGITELKSFPDNTVLKGPSDFILMQKAPDADAVKETPYTVKFVSGTIIVSVRKPSLLGMVETPLGRVAVFGNADVQISYKDGVMRIQNLDGVGNNLRVSLSKGPFGGNPVILALAPGHEIIAADRKLTRADLTTNDGILRRTPKLIGDGKIAVSQFSLESLLSNSALIAQMNQKETGSKEQRVLADMSRMAAVLNHVNGVEGYKAQ